MLLSCLNDCCGVVICCGSDLGDEVREARLKWLGHMKRRDSEYIWQGHAGDGAAGKRGRPEDDRGYAVVWRDRGRRRKRGKIEKKKKIHCCDSLREKPKEEEESDKAGSNKLKAMFHFQHISLKSIHYVQYNCFTGSWGSPGASASCQWAKGRARPGTSHQSITDDTTYIFLTAPIHCTVF